MGIQLTKEQAAVVHDRGGELLVSAAAGSGKTRVLVERLLERVEAGADLDRFLVITFTKAAAAELRLKILDALHQRLAEQPENRHLRRQTTLVYRTKISTIDSFCTDFLRESGHQLDIDPDFRVADQTEADLLRRQTLDRVLESHYEHIDDDFSALMDAFSAGQDDERLRTMVLSIHEKIQSHDDPRRWLTEQGQRFDVSHTRDVGETDWGDLLLRDTKKQVDYWSRRLCETLDLMQGDHVLELNYGDSIRQTMDDLDDYSEALDRGWDSARALCTVSYPTLGRKRGVQDKIAQERVKKIREDCKKATQKLEERFDADSAELLEELNAVRKPVLALFALVQEFDDAFAAAKRRRKLLDFSDLEHITAAALRGTDGEPTELARRWQSRFDEVMVDEYQDTNQIQNAIFDALTDGGQNLFQVGDVKQSIYRFRQADPTIFLKKYENFRHAAEAKEGQSRKLILSRNFRSRKSVLDAVNFVFTHLMSRDFGELDYGADQMLNHPEFEDVPLPDDVTELDIVDCGEVEQDETEAKVPRDDIEARFVAKRVHELLTQPFMIAEGGAARPVRPEDIALLYRSPNSIRSYLTRALDGWNIPWQIDSTEDCFATTEVQVAVSYLQIVDNPRQDVPLISVLRSPVYGFTGDELAMLRSGHREGDFYDCVLAGAEGGSEKCARFLSDLTTLRSRMSDTTCAQLLWSIYDDLGLRSLFAAMPGGQRREDNLLAFYNYARSFERGGHRGVFALVTELRRLVESGNTPLMNTTTVGSGVRIMSIHRSKGLEFPVVILGGLSRGYNKQDENSPMLFHSDLGIGPKRLDARLRMEYPTIARTAVRLKLDREMKAEELRLLYVAMTRARDKLIMVMSDRKAQDKLRKMASVAGPHPDPEALMQQPSMGDCMLLPILARFDAAHLLGGESVEEHALADDRWDIRLVTADNSLFAPETVEKMAETAQEQTAGAESDLSGLTWRYPYQAVTEMPSKVTATQLKGRALDEEAAAETARPPRPMEFRRPDFIQKRRGLTSAQRGTAVHAVMQLADLDKVSTAALVREEIARLVSGHWLTPEQGEAVPAWMVASFWSSQLGQEALRHRDTLKREQKFSILADAALCDAAAPAGEQVLLQGVIDCCFETEEGLVVVDFKTDYVNPGEEAAKAETYRTQLEVYTRALSEITGKDVIRRYLWFFRTKTAIAL